MIYDDELYSEEQEIEEMSLDELRHYGMPRRSGRYPWGSGEDPYQHGSQDFLSRVEELKKKGWEETAENIKKEFGEHVTLNDYRNEKAWCNYERRLLQVETAKALKADGLGATAIGRKMGINESTVRSLLNEKSEGKMKEVQETYEFLKANVDEKRMVDVGTGVEHELNVSKERIDLALYKLRGEGYEVYSGGIPQINNKGQQTTQKVLCAPGTEHKEIYNYDQVHSLKEYISRDGGKTYERKFYPPESLDSKRMMVRYKEDGGEDKDGIVELRRGVADLSLGDSHYSQVRILVDKTHYIKGMAIYSDDMPPGVDVIFNTNKTKDKSLHDVLKKIKDDPENPFGSLIKDANQGGQYWYDADTGKRCSALDPNVKNKKLGLINKRSDEGDWDDWQDALPSQFLGKQSLALAKKQLNLAKVDKLAEYDDICSLNNPTVKKHLLEKFADGCDSAAVHLKAAALPGQKYHVIIPINTLKDTEIYAPKYENGTKLALVRYPHAGTFEIPIVTVNNKNPLAKKVIGDNSLDAVGITKKVADRLSGADFDGDTVMCIPTHDKAGKVKITSTKALADLEGFDPKLEYPERPGMKYMKDPVTGKDNTQIEMGKISNLITDMTLLGCTDPSKMARAVKHSMVVIDAAKHKLDYKRSEIENNIDALKKEYQIREKDIDGNVTKYGGAATILSRAKGETSIDRRQGTPKVNLKGKEWYDPTKPEGANVYKTADDLYYPDRTYDKSTGTVTYKTTAGKKVSFDIKDKDAYDYYNPVPIIDPNDPTKKKIIGYTNKTGEITYKTKTKLQKSTKMAEAQDAYSLVSESRHPMEMAYAEYANSMKALANQARKEMATTGKIKYDTAANKVYKAEVSSLKAKLNNALLNAARERAAQRRANAELETYKANNVGYTKEDVKKKGQQALNKAREDVNSIKRSDRSIDITDREWEAIQAGAVSEATLKKILDNTDIDKLRERATPRTTSTLSESKIAKIQNMNASNFTLEQIAKSCGVSVSTVTKYLKGAKK